MERARARARASVLAEFIWKGKFPSKLPQSGLEIYNSHCNSASFSSSSVDDSIMSKDGDCTLLQEAFSDETYRKLLKT